MVAEHVFDSRDTWISPLSTKNNFSFDRIGHFVIRRYVYRPTVVVALECFNHSHHRNLLLDFSVPVQSSSLLLRPSPTVAFLAMLPIHSVDFSFHQAYVACLFQVLGFTFLIILYEDYKYYKSCLRAQKTFCSFLNY